MVDRFGVFEREAIRDTHKKTLLLWAALSNRPPFSVILQDAESYNHQDGHEQNGDKEGDMVKSGIAFAGGEVVFTHIFSSSA